MSQQRVFQPFSPMDRADVSTALLTFVTQLKPLLLSGFGEGPSGSRAQRLGLIHDPNCSQGPFPGRNAMETALFAALAGVDHLQSLAHALQRADAAFSTATITRGAVESFARAWWLIEPESDNEVMYRWLSAMASEMAMLIKVNPSLVLGEMHGRNTRADEVRQNVLDDIGRLTGSRNPLNVSPTKLATELGDKTGLQGRWRYSHLSGVAHGESTGIHGFVDVDDNAGVYRIGLNARWAAMYAHQAFLSASYVSRQMLAVLGRSVPPGHPCAVAHDAASEAIVRAHMNASTPSAG
ncbi:hypothetical protein [Microbacterium sp. CFBP 8794]|uniref:hypothetical protein n=1 Tax=Microbacterium sp. CFBP 8794 TaxID=2775269 RepID=UPI0017848A22|nr:hypothetical protein [Microbacterium sp. CFBP 8794]MBD8477702.1 hypothetical protein [Microbacterium sp. CFBP 8794]